MELCGRVLRSDENTTPWEPTLAFIPFISLPLTRLSHIFITLFMVKTRGNVLYSHVFQERRGVSKTLCLDKSFILKALAL